MPNVGRVLVTGASGFLGRHLLPLLGSRYGTSSVTATSSREHDLMNPAEVSQLISGVRPDVVIHLAGYSMGIDANRRFPADFYHRNTLLTALMFDACSRFKVKKLIYPMPGCSYPSQSAGPLSENQIWDGFPQNDSAAYALSKRMGLIAANAYRQQHDLNTTVIIPANVYGEYDNFDLLNGHVVPAMIRKFYEAALQKASRVTLWGSGRPIRNFLYARDVAQLIPFFIESYDEIGPINLATRAKTSIADLAATVASSVGYRGEIFWDHSRPDGEPVKVFSTVLLERLGLTCPTPLKDGIQRTASWFVKNYTSKSDQIRL